eukprot:5461764-Alexandrium_andersonii.AAC.1
MLSRVHNSVWLVQVGHSRHGPPLKRDGQGRVHIECAMLEQLEPSRDGEGRIVEAIVNATSNPR